MRATVEDHGCTGKGKHATQTTQRFSRPMPLLLLYHAPSFRSLCTEGCARTVRLTCVGVRNVICEFIRTAVTLLFAQVWTGFFWVRTVHVQCTYQEGCPLKQKDLVSVQDASKAGQVSL